MILSHKHKFIFLKTMKTASTSIELALTKVCGDDDIISPLSIADEALRADGRGAQNWRRHGWWQSPRPIWKRRVFKVAPQDYGFYNHIPAAAAKALIEDDRVWSSYFKFAFDRNPWDRQVSYYYHCYRSSEARPSFEHFMRGQKARLNNYNIYSIGGDLAVDFVGRYECLEEDMKRALAQVGLAADFDLPRAKGSFRKDQRPYRDYYTPSTQRIVAEWYEPEISLLGYRF